MLIMGVVSRGKHQANRNAKTKRDPAQTTLVGGGGGGATGGRTILGDDGRRKSSGLSRAIAQKIWDVLIPVLQQTAVTLLPGLGPLITIAYSMYFVWQNEEKLAKVAAAINDNDFDTLAEVLLKETAKKGIELAANIVATKLADASAERLREAGLFDKMPEIKQYYNEFVKESINEIINDKKEEFINSL